MFHIDQKIVRFVTSPNYNTAAPRIVHPAHPPQTLIFPRNTLKNPVGHSNRHYTTLCTNLCNGEWRK